MEKKTQFNVWSLTIAVHALWVPREDAARRASGISCLGSSDTIQHPYSVIHLEPLLADTLKEMQI